MKALKFVLAGILISIICVVLGGFILPSTVHVERSIEIERSVDTVFPKVNSLRAFQSWSPWAAIDPNTKTDYFGPESGEGAGMEWRSDNPQVGNGKQMIIESVKNSQVKTRLEFGDNSMGHASWSLESVGDNTRVTWSYDMVLGHNPIMRYFGLAMDGMLGPFYEKGLNSLKEIVEAQPVIVSEVVEYQAGGTLLKGFLAYPQGVHQAPGVLVVHEWWGHNDFTRERAIELAKEGYVALALDMYGDGKSTGHPKEANGFMTEVLGQDGAILERFTSAMALLKAQDAVDPKNIAAFGYCFGGGVALSMARAGVDLAGVVSFHGSLKALPPIAQGVDTPVLVFNGEEDPFITAEQIAQFKSEMSESAMPYEFVNFPGAVHAFTNPGATAKGEEYGLPLKYDEEADKRSWSQALAFLKEVFEP